MKIHYGSYATLDCPVKKQDKVFDWLYDEFFKIKGFVRVMKNPHDFGEYPSFEVDMPKELEEVDPSGYNEDIDGECAVVALDEWTEKANQIELKYYKKFFKEV
jgi:hypothetical protein